MKTMISRIAFIAIVIMAFPAILNAQGTIHFYLSITDNCSGTWTRDYFAHVWITEGINTNCTFDTCGLVGSGSLNSISFYCNHSYSESDCDYGIHVTVWRDGSPTCNGTGSDGTGNKLCFRDLNDSKTVYVTLQ